MHLGLASPFVESVRRHKTPAFRIRGPERSFHRRGLGTDIDEFVPDARVFRPLGDEPVSGCAKARINGEQQIPHPAICGAGDDSERWVGI